MTIHTTDPTMMHKLDKLCESSPENYERVLMDKVNGEVFSKTYEVADKTLLSFRAKKTKMELTDEQRAKLAERLKNTMAKRAK